MAYSTPFNDPSYCHETQADTEDGRTFQQGQDGDVLAEGSSSRVYPTSHADSVSNLATLGNMRPNMNTLFGFHGNVNFSQSSESFLPSADPSYFNPTALPIQLDSFPTALETESIIPSALDSNGYFPMELDIPLPTLNVEDQMTPLENVPTGPAGFPNLGHVGIWDEGLLSAINDPFLLSNTG